MRLPEAIEGTGSVPDPLGWTLTARVRNACSLAERCLCGRLLDRLRNRGFQSVGLAVTCG